MKGTTFIYVTYIRTTPEKLWAALTQPEFTKQYWAQTWQVSDWQPGSPWEHQRTDGSGIADGGGVILEAAPPHRLTMTFGEAGSGAEPDASRVTFLIEAHHDIVRLTVTHQNLAADDVEAVSAGWPAVMANLKSLLETGHVLPQPPWEMHVELRASQMARNDPR